MGTGNVQTVKILDDIRSYLNGLDNIILVQNENQDNSDIKYCSEKLYGHLIIVINKMLGNDSDIKLQRELMENEPGNWISSYFFAS